MGPLFTLEWILQIKYSIIMKKWSCQIEKRKREKKWTSFEEHLRRIKKWFIVRLLLKSVYKGQKADFMGSRNIGTWRHEDMRWVEMRWVEMR